MLRKTVVVGQRCFRFSVRQYSQAALDDGIQELFSGCRTVFDLTFGDGHHSRLLLGDQHRRVLALDRDPDVQEKYAKIDDNNFCGFWGKFSDLPKIARENKEHLHEWFTNCDGILLDFGVSQSQLNSGKGFCIGENAPLDLRMDNTGISAQELLRHLDMDNLIKIMRAGGVKNSKNIVTDIIERRYLQNDIKTSKDLYELCHQCFSGLDQFSGTGHTALETNISRVFLALRMFVNNELNEMKFVLRLAESILNKGGKLVTVLHTKKEEDYFRSFLYSSTTSMSTKQTWNLEVHFREQETPDGHSLVLFCAEKL